GADTLAGGTGNDIYIVDNTGDTVTENSGEGTDTVRSSATYTLSANVENLTLTGSSNINGIGNSLNNTITGNSGDNTLSGGVGNDTLDGGSGIDTIDYSNDTAAVTVSLLSITATDGAGGHDVLFNFENVVSSIYADVITGNSGANTLIGNAGNDSLIG